MEVDRKTFLGGSEVAAVLGLDPWRSALDVWAAKTGRVEPVERSPAMRIGLRLERPLLAEYAERKGAMLSYPGTVLHEAEPWIGATPDALADGPDGRRVVEIKVVGLRRAHDWRTDGAEGAEGVPSYVYAQVQWQLLAVDAHAAHVVALLGTDLRIHDVPRDTEFLSHAVAVADLFWRRHVLGDKMPRVERPSRDALTRLYPRVLRDDLAPATVEAETLAREYVAYGEDIEKLEEKRATYGDRLRALIGDGRGVEGPWGRVTWQEQRGRVDWQGLARSLGMVDRALEDKFRGEPSRVLRVSLAHEER